MFDERLKSLPVPTLKQTAQFADHVADNHSWYKHLPLFPPGASFVVFANPYAGRGVRANGDRFAVYDVGRGDYFHHHSRLSTVEYLAQFGHWDYWVGDNPRMPDRQPGPWLYGPDGDRELLTENLKRQWSCRLTAFLKPGLPMFSLRASELQREAEMFRASAPTRLGRALQGVFGRRPKGAADRSAAERYCRIADELRQADGSWDTPALFQLVGAEAAAQRAVLFDTLHRVRVAWSEGRAADAAPSDAANSGIA